MNSINKITKKQIEEIVAQKVNMKKLNGSMKTYIEFFPKKNSSGFRWECVQFIRNFGIFGFYSVNSIIIPEKFIKLT